MNFKMKYQIKRLYLTAPSMRRSGQRMDKIKFIVAHDTGNEGSTARANVMYYSKTENEQSASAHIFVDHAEIIECIPSMDKPEKAWHVLYNVKTDDERYGANANDCAVGVELCYGGSVNTKEAYARYIWTLAYLCHVYDLDPRLHIVGHYELDPKRKTDPVNALKTIGRTMDDLLEDVAFELELCRYGDDPQMQELLRRIEALEKLTAQPCPEWAKAAVESASKKGLINSVDSGSRDYWRLLTILHRAKLI